jgi:hypothetical protein
LRDGFLSYFIKGIIDYGAAGDERKVAPSYELFGVRSAVPDFGSIFCGAYIIGIEVSAANIIRPEGKDKIFQDGRLKPYQANLNFP